MNKPCKIDELKSENRLLRNMIKALLNKWWLFSILGILGGIGGIWYASIQQIQYQSHLTFALDEGASEGGGLSGAASLAAQFGLSVGGANDVFAGDNITEIMLSRRVIERVLLSVDTFENKSQPLIEYYLKMSGKRNTADTSFLNIHFFPGENRTTFSYQKNKALYKVYRYFLDAYISARKPNKKLNIYEVSVVSVSEKFTKIFTDRLINETNAFYTEIRSKKSKETLAILEQRTQAMKGNFNKSLENNAIAQDANLNTSFAAARVPVIKEQANSQVYGGAYGEMFKNLEMARYQYLKSIPLMQVIDAAEYPMEKITVGKLKTGLIFSFITVFIGCLIFMLINLFKFKKSSNT